ncbi:hypothetical protein SK128_008584 [Halocaridina rubra]|uniref:Rab proteins geranylgeranyltransferase component A n=1 Tax=Halocaridina rubra TaxID=373956 RepID=A0AAN9AEC9_HALRR
MEVELPTEYDVIVVGTGFVECIVAAASARVGKKVLHIDKNDYYGGQWASFSLQGMEEWIEASEQQEKANETVHDVAKGERTLLTCNPMRAHTNIKRTWHIKKESEMAPAGKTSLSELRSQDETGGVSAEGSTKEPVADNDVSVDAKIPSRQESETTSTCIDLLSEMKSQDEKGDIPSGEDTKEPVPVNDESVEATVPPSEPTDKACTKEMEEVESHTEAVEVVESNAMGSIKEENSNNVPTDESKEIRCWSQESLLKQSRRFNLDLAPKLLFSRGPLVELLISSNVARYAEFKCITRVLTWVASGEDIGELVVVPCSRSDVFTTSNVSLVEKRLLMKLLEFCHNFDQHLEELEEYDNKTFIEFLKARKQTPNLIHFVTESIAMVDGNVSCKEGLEKTKLFLTSLGRYGTTPFLFSMYGCGELPQAFCRLCAVFEGTYVLRRSVSSIVLNADNACSGIISEGVCFKCSHLVMDTMYAPHQYIPVSNASTSKSISRGIFIIDRSILPNKTEQLTLLRVPVQGRNLKPVTVIEVGIGAGICPKDLYCVHMTCEGSDAEEDLRVVAERLFAVEETSVGPRVLWSLYFNQLDLSNTDTMEGVPENIHLCSGPDASLDYDTAISQAHSLFTRMFPEEQFLPRAPDPEEIVFDNAGAEPKEGDNFGSEECPKQNEERGSVDNANTTHNEEAESANYSDKEDTKNTNSGTQRNVSESEDITTTNEFNDTVAS